MSFDDSLDIVSPKNILNIAQNRPSQEAEAFFQIIRNISKRNIENVNRTLSDDELEEVTEFLQDEIEIDFTKEQIKQLLNLYPKVRVAVILHGLNDTEVMQDLADMVANFFLNSRAAVFGDDLDGRAVEIFGELIKQQAKLMGYQLREKEIE